jgi:hypothetical protein
MEKVWSFHDKVEILHSREENCLLPVLRGTSTEMAHFIFLNLIANDDGDNDS